MDTVAHDIREAFEQATRTFAIVDDKDRAVRTAVTDPLLDAWLAERDGQG